MKIRRAEPGDVKAIAELMCDVQDLHVAARPEHFKPSELSAMQARAERKLTAIDTKCFVAELEGQIIGYATALRRTRTENPLSIPSDYCAIDEISVTPTHRRRGAATALLHAIADDAHASGLAQVELSSWAFNESAHRAFAAAGFVPKTITFELKK
jgi:GNAT superfamily N-acetyltransferase